MSKISAAIRSPRDMDEFLELHSAQEIIDAIKHEISLNAFGSEMPAAEDEIIGALLNVCGGVPFLATCIYETVEKAELRLVTK